MSEIRSQATPARDELAAVLMKLWGWLGPDAAKMLVEQVEAAGWSKPRTVNSAGELHTLPVESVVRNANGWIGEISIVSGKPVIFWIGNECEAGLDDITLPVTVLFTPGGAG